MQQIILLLIAGIGGYTLYKRYLEKGGIGPTLTEEGKIINLPQLETKSETKKLEISQEGNLRIQLKPQVIKKDGQPIATYVPSPITIDLNKLVANITDIFQKKSKETTPLIQKSQVSLSTPTVLSEPSIKTTKILWEG